MRYIYGIYNKISGKLYIGQTNNPKRRWSEHKRCSKSIALIKYAINFAMKKYGVQNFIFKIIDTAKNLDESNNKEKQWIKELKLHGYQLYNETEGGTVGYSKPWTDEQKQAASQKWTDEQRQAVSKRVSGEGNPMYGVQLFGEANGNYGKEMKPHVKETLLKIRRKLTDEQIEEIKNLYATGNHTQTQLAKDFEVSLTQIHRIVHGKSWGDKKHDEVLTKKNLTKEDVIEIRKLYASGKYLQKELAEKFGCSQNHIHHIITYKKWKNI